MSHTSSSAERADVYTRITAEIVAAIEAGAGAWRMPWHHDGTAITRPQNISSGNRNRGVNVLALWIAAQAHGYADGLWGTYRQWLAIGAQAMSPKSMATNRRSSRSFQRAIASLTSASSSMR
jgi:antirestriction protein ArdC